MQDKTQFFLDLVIKLATIKEVSGSNLGAVKVKKFQFVNFFASRFRNSKNHLFWANFCLKARYFF